MISHLATVNMQVEVAFIPDTSTNSRRRSIFNDEPSSTVEVRLQEKTMSFDWTKWFSHLGRFSNRSTIPNLRLHPLLFVRGNIELGFIPSSTNMGFQGP